MKDASETIFPINPVAFDSILNGQAELQDATYQWEKDDCEIYVLEDLLVGCGGLSLLLGLLVVLKQETVYLSYRRIWEASMKPLDLRKLDEELRFLAQHHQTNKQNISLDI